MYEIYFYETPKGECPVREFLNSLDNKMLAKALRTIDLLEMNGPELRAPYSKHLRNGIFELRVRSGNNNTRIMYFFYVGKKVILTNGFMKKTQKTPEKELTVAEKYKREFEVRCRNEEL